MNIAGGRRAARWCLAGIASIVGVLVISELGLRALAPQPPSKIDCYRKHPRLPLYALMPDQNRYITNGETDWTLRTNNQGERIGAAALETSAASPTILILGGTNIFGHGVDHEESLPGLIEQATPGVRAINAAVPVFGPTQSAMILEDQLAQGCEPDLVLVGFCPGTDFGHTLIEKNVTPRAGCLPEPGAAKGWLRHNLHLYRLCTRILHAHRTGGDPPLADFELLTQDQRNWDQPWLREAVSRTRAAFTQIKQTCASRGIPLLVVIVASPAMVTGIRDAMAAGNPPSTPPQEKAWELLRSLRIPFIDPTGALARQPAGSTHQQFDRHLTPLSHALIHSAIRDRLAACLASRPETAPQRTAQ